MANRKLHNRRRQDAATRQKARSERLARASSVVLRVGGALVLAAALCFGGWETWGWARTSPTFALKTWVFTGLHHTSEAELIRLSGLKKGQNLFAIDPSTVVRALSKDPWVKSARVSRHWPSGIAIAIQEHHSAALVSVGALYLLDDDGVPFKRVEPSDRLDLPLVTGIGRDDYLRDPKGAITRFRDALALAAAYRTTHPGAKDRLSEVHLGDDGTSLVTASGETVYLGESGANAFVRLAKVRRVLREKGLKAEAIHLDDRVRPGWVAVRLSTPVSERSGSRK